MVLYWPSASSPNRDQVFTEAETFLGLAGIGDLLLTCTGDLSRNRRIGLGLGHGRKLEEIVAELGEVAEGVQTTRAAVRLAARLGVEAPITNMVRSIIDGEKTPAEAGYELMTRQLRSERDPDQNQNQSHGQDHAQEV